MRTDREALLAQAREYIDPDGYAWTSWWDEKQAGAIIKRLIEELEKES